MKPYIPAIHSPYTSVSDPQEESAQLRRLEYTLHSSHSQAGTGDFIPRGTLEVILQPDLIRRVLEESLPSMPKPSLERCANEITGHAPPFLKIFALLVLSGATQRIGNFVDSGVDDSYLSMPDPGPSGSLGIQDSSDTAQEQEAKGRSRWNFVLWGMGVRHTWSFFDRWWGVLSPVFEGV
ncbi:hypothetical protein BCR34DRAFT_578285 [Clohesyomyces aquaticus]|uniref:Uncharacterized protein n=1 Tax=Clohesyomyces aquaticus TaxID=1231657 RepID=A0A1Y1YFX9_9PLEO|nr:hypothetical protein BCR34DRAFT_578285 [Clohesyomyces aquaticus]